MAFSCGFFRAFGKTPKLGTGFFKISLGATRNLAMNKFIAQPVKQCASDCKQKQHRLLLLAAKNVES